MEALFHHYEIDLSKTKRLSLGIEEGCRQLAEGEIDALLLVLSLKSQAIEDLVSGGEVNLVGIGDSIDAGSEIAGFRLSYPYVEPYLTSTYAYAMPHGQAAGVPEVPVPTLAVRTVLVAHRDLPDYVARSLTRLVMENQSRLNVGGQ